MIHRESPSLTIKSKKPKTFNILDTSIILSEKNEALKSIEFDDDDFEDIEDIESNSIDTRSTKDKETKIDDNYIIIVSDRNCENNEFILEKNICKLEKHIKKVFKKMKKCKNNF
jgi:hypothetical protein